jgi:hypothetical protein
MPTAYRIAKAFHLNSLIDNPCILLFWNHWRFDLRQMIFRNTEILSIYFPCLFYQLKAGTVTGAASGALNMGLSGMVMIV